MFVLTFGNLITPLPVPVVTLLKQLEKQLNQGSYDICFVNLEKASQDKFVDDLETW